MLVCVLCTELWSRLLAAGLSADTPTVWVLEGFIGGWVGEAVGGVQIWIERMVGCSVALSAVFVLLTVRGLWITGAGAVKRSWLVVLAGRCVCRCKGQQRPRVQCLLVLERHTPALVPPDTVST